MNDLRPAQIAEIVGENEPQGHSAKGEQQQKGRQNDGGPSKYRHIDGKLSVHQYRPLMANKRAVTIVQPGHVGCGRPVSRSTAMQNPSPCQDREK